ncbi:uncharacterized protein [Nicotiana sylvestris]|uniref:uncharacterized protein n=1 Tax=Nicotiana sylvestris TaxID=4096 RepID=UPI00388CCDBD
MRGNRAVTHKTTGQIVIEKKAADKQNKKKHALTLRQEAFSKSRVELNRHEANLKRLTEERNALKLLSGQKEEEIKDFRAELLTTNKEQTNLIKRVQQKAEKIKKLCEEANMTKAETFRWKQNMDRLTSKNNTTRAQLSSAERQIQSIKVESLARAKKIEELEARLAVDLAKVASEADRVKAEVESRRETLEKIHARGFDLAVHIENVKLLEAEAKALLSSSSDESGNASGSESGENEDEALGED